jgi:hypothetical protein
MIRRNTIFGYSVALGMNENRIGCIFLTSMDNKQVAAAETTAVIPELSCVTLERYQIRI